MSDLKDAVEEQADDHKEQIRELRELHGEGLDDMCDMVRAVLDRFTTMVGGRFNQNDARFHALAKRLGMA